MPYTNVGSFVSLQQCNVYSPGCPGCNGCLSCEGNQVNAMDRGRACSGSGYLENPLEESTVTAARTLYVKHPATRTGRTVEISSMHPVGEGAAEVPVGDGYAMLWDTVKDEPYTTSVNSCPRGYRLYAGRCFRRFGARASAPAPQQGPQKAQLPGRMPRGVSRGLTTAPRPSMRPAPMGFAPPPRGPAPRPMPGSRLTSAADAQTRAKAQAFVQQRHPGAIVQPHGTSENDELCWAVWRGGKIVDICCVDTTPGGDGMGCLSTLTLEPKGPAAPSQPMPSQPAATVGTRAVNPTYPVTLNPYSLPWNYPWAYTFKQHNQEWGYTHPRYGYMTPWSGQGGWRPGCEGRAYYDRVPGQQTPLNTILGRAR